MLGYRIKVSNSPAFYDYAKLIFDFLWNIPSSGYYSTLKNTYNIDHDFMKYINISFTWDTYMSEYTIKSTTSIEDEIYYALDASADIKVITSSEYFPDQIQEDFEKVQTLAYSTALLEQMQETSVFTTMYTTTKAYQKHPNMYYEIAYSNAESHNFDVYKCGGNIDGLIIAAIDDILFAPVNYYQALEPNSVILGVVYKDAELFNNFMTFINENVKTHCPRLSVN